MEVVAMGTQLAGRHWDDIVTRHTRGWSIPDGQLRFS